MSTKKFTEEACNVWDHYVKLENCDFNDPIAECKYCQKQYHFNAMLTHINFGCEKYPCSSHAPLGKTQREGESESSNVDVTNISVERLRLGLARMIMIDELPLRLVEGEGFIDLMAMI